MSNIVLEDYDIYQLRLDEAVLEKGFKHCIKISYEIPRDTEIGSIGTILFEETSKNKHIVLMDTLGIVLQAERRNTTAYLEGYGNSNEVVNAAIEAYKAVYPPAPEPVDDEIQVKFWYLTKDGPTSVTRNIAVPSWDSIKDNYSSSTRDGLDDLINRFVPDSGGKIILWHGVPGTGKTYALRSLVKHWKKWANISYILDPEALFGSSPGYMAQMVFTPEERYMVDEEGDAVKEEEKWKILILEDTGELLSDNARERAGQGLSRLLNLADGFIGQGLRVLIIITTNEEVGTLHPAVAREGRCAARINFSELSQQEAKIWASKNDAIIPAGHDKGWTLADLYAHKNTAKIDVAPKMEKVGFRMPKVVKELN